MGADVIGWRGCELQETLGPDGFLGKLKLRAYRGAVEAQIEPAQRDTIKINVQVTNRPTRTLRYPEIVRELAEFEAGIPLCATCPLSGGRPIGCYRYVTYPVDAGFERLVFDFFTSQVATEGSISWQLYTDLVSQLEDGDGWYEGRGGGPGSLAELDEPLELSWEDDAGEHVVDSAQLLACLFITLDVPELVMAYARFWGELLEYAATLAAVVSVEPGGGDAGDAVQVVVDGSDQADDVDVDELARRATLPLVAHTSRTLREIRAVHDLLIFAAAGALDEGWQVLVDS